MTRTIVCTLLALSACDATTPDGPTPTPDVDPAASKPLQAELQCADLAGAPRLQLRLAKDGRSLTFVETREVPGEKGRTTGYLIRFDLASGETTTIQDDVASELHLSDDGTLVFTRLGAPLKYLPDRRYSQLFVARPGAAAVALTEAEGVVEDVVVDSASGIAYYRGGKTIAMDFFKVALTGGAPEKIEGMGVPLGYDAERGALLRGSFGSVSWYALGDASETPVPIPPRSFLGATKTHIFVLLDGKQIAALPTAKAANATAPIDLGLELGDGSFDVRDRDVVFTVPVPRGNTVWISDGGPPAARLTVLGAKPRGLVELDDGRIATMLVHDTDGDGNFTVEDEADLCFIKNLQPDRTIEAEVRRVPRQLLEPTHAIAAKAREIGLEGALHWSTEDDAWTLTVEPAGDGPTDLATLRERVRALRTAAAPHIEKTTAVVLRYRANGRKAVSRWDEHGAQHLTTAGIGDAQLADPGEYAFEIDPKVTTTVKRDPYSMRESTVGSAVCTGTLKNIGATALEGIEVECSNDIIFEGARARAPLKPPSLAPGASGNYKVKLAIADGARPFPLIIRAGGSERSYLNAFLERNIAGLHDAVTVVQASTGLTYEWAGLKTDPDSYTPKKIRIITLRAPADFAKKGLADQNSLAKTARGTLIEHFSKQRTTVDSTTLNILEHDRERIGWRLERDVLLPEE